MKIDTNFIQHQRGKIRGVEIKIEFVHKFPLKMQIKTNEKKNHQKSQMILPRNRKSLQQIMTMKRKRKLIIFKTKSEEKKLFEKFDK